MFLSKEKIDFSFEGATNYKLLYIVDSIIIEDPILIYHNIGYVCSKSLLDSMDINKDFFKRHDVFMYIAPSTFDWTFSPDEINAASKYSEIISRWRNFEVCEEVSLIYSDETVNLDIIEFPENISFALALINANLFNRMNFVYMSDFIDNKKVNFHYPFYSRKEIDITTSYYKAVIPLCKN